MILATRALERLRQGIPRESGDVLTVEFWEGRHVPHSSQKEDDSCEAYVQTAHGPVKSLVGKCLRAAVNKPQRAVKRR